MAAGDLQDYMGNFFGGGSDPSAAATQAAYSSPATSQGSLSVTTPGGSGSEATTSTPSAGQTARTPVPTTQQTVDPTLQSTTAPTIYPGGIDANTITGFYQKYLNRTPTADEITAASGHPGGAAALEQFIAGSPEAASVAASQQAPSQSWSGTGQQQTGNGTGFADPAYQQLLNLVNSRLGQLQQPVSFPALDQYLSMLTQNEAAAKQRAQTFADQLTQRVGQLQQPLLSDANVVQQRALASNNLLGQRDTALANARQNVASRGFAPTSGIGIDQGNQIAQNYTNAQAQIDAQLQQGNIAQDEQRRNEATQLQGLAQQALQGGDVTALQNQATQADLENQLFNLNQNRANQTLAVGQIPVDLTNQGFANSLNAVNSTPNPLTSIMSLLALGNQQQGIQQTGQNNNATGLGNVLSWLLQGA